MFQLTSVSGLWDVVVIFCSSIVGLIVTGNFLVVPLYSDSNVTTDNADRNLDATVHSQLCIFLKESNLQSQGRVSVFLHIYLFLSNFVISFNLNPINVLVISHGKLCCAHFA